MILAAACLVMMASAGWAGDPAARVDWSRPLTVNRLELGMTYEEVKAILGQGAFSARYSNNMWEIHHYGELAMLRFNLQQPLGEEWRMSLATGTQLEQSGRVVLAVGTSRGDAQQLLGPPDTTDEVAESPAEEDTPCVRDTYLHLSIQKPLLIDRKNFTVGRVIVEYQSGSVCSVSILHYR